MNKIDYGKVLLKLFPIGIAFLGENLKKLCSVIGKEFLRVREALYLSLEELPPNLKFNLTDWERFLNIKPNKNDSIEDRNTRVLAKLAPLKGHSELDYQEFIYSLIGVVPTIRQNKVLLSGFDSGKRCFSYRWYFVIFIDGISPNKFNLIKDIMGIYKQSHSRILINIGGLDVKS